MHSQPKQEDTDIFDLLGDVKEEPQLKQTSEDNTQSQNDDLGLDDLLNIDFNKNTPEKVVPAPIKKTTSTSNNPLDSILSLYNVSAEQTQVRVSSDI